MNLAPWSPDGAHVHGQQQERSPPRPRELPARRPAGHTEHHGDHRNHGGRTPMLMRSSARSRTEPGKGGPQSPRSRANREMSRFEPAQARSMTPPPRPRRSRAAVHRLPSQLRWWSRGVPAESPSPRRSTRRLRRRPPRRADGAAASALSESRLSTPMPATARSPPTIRLPVKRSPSVQHRQDQREERHCDHDHRGQTDATTFLA